MKNLHPVYFVFLSFLHGFVFAPPKYSPSPKHAIQPVASFTAPTISIQSGTFQTITIGPVTGAEICQGQSLVLEATASPTPFRYNWYLDASYIGTGNTISVNQEGDYTARAADASNVEGADSAPITVFVNHAPAQLSIQYTGSASFCNTTPITLNAQLNTGQRAAYQWFLNGAPIATGSSYSTNVAGNYTVQATNYCGSLTSAVVTLNQVTAAPTGLSVSAAGGATQICSGDNILLSTSLGGGSSVGYQWYLNSLASPISGATNSTYSATAAGNYLVQAFNGCGTVQSSYNLTGGSAPASTTLLNTSPTLACQGTSVVLNATQVGANILGYEWYKDGVLVRNTTISSALFTQSGLYTVRAFNNCGPSPISNAVTVGIVSPPQNTSFTFDVAPSIGCTNLTTRFFANSDIAPSTNANYEWYKVGSGLVASGSAYTISSTGFYYFKAIADNNCGTRWSDTVEIVAVTQPPPPVDLRANTTSTCTGSITLTATNVGKGAGYEWYRDNVLVTRTLQNTYTASVSGSYKVRALNACGITGFSGEIPLQFFNSSLAKPIVSTTGGINSTCLGGTLLLTAQTLSPAPVVRWFRNGNLIQGANSLSFGATEAGVYNVEISNNICSFLSDPFSVFITNVPDVQLTYDGALAFCEGDSLNLFATTSDNTLTFTWLKDGQMVGTGRRFTARDAGAYPLTLRATNTCGGSRDQTVQLIVTPRVVPPIEVRGSRLLMTELSDFYQWRLNGSPILNATQATYTALQPGRYSVLLINQVGCRRLSDEVEIGANQIANDWLQLYPNPSPDGLIKALVLRSGKGSLRVLSQTGEQIWEQSWQASVNPAREISFQLNGQGVYLIVVEVEGVITTKKVIVQ